MSGRSFRGFLRWLPYRLGYEAAPWAMSWLRQRWVLLRHPHAHVRFGRGVYLGPGFSLDMRGAGTFIVGDHAEFRRDFRAEIAGEGRVTIGEATHFTYGGLIQCSTTIDIGSRCMFAQSAILLDGQHRFRDLTLPLSAQGYDFRHVLIEDDVWVGAHSTIMNSIGRRAVIGANTVVTKPVPAFTVSVGAPARPIDYFGPPPDKRD